MFNHKKVPLALRLSGQLLLGVVCIYARKLELLHRDADDALLKIRQARAPRRWRWCREAGKRRKQVLRFEPTVGTAARAPVLFCARSLLNHRACAQRLQFKDNKVLQPDTLRGGDNTEPALLDYDSLDFYVADDSESMKHTMRLQCVPRCVCLLWRACTRREGVAAARHAGAPLPPKKQHVLHWGLGLFGRRAARRAGRRPLRVSKPRAGAACAPATRARARAPRCGARGDAACCRARARFAASSCRPRFLLSCLCAPRPLASRGGIDLADPFRGSMLGDMHDDEGARRSAIDTQNAFCISAATAFLRR
jgi:hypothetical protein